MLKKIDRMHDLFGKSPGNQCRKCFHLIGGVNEYRKCAVYGQSVSEATDWRLSYPACGLWNKPVPKGMDIPVVRLNIGARNEELQVPGQMSLF